MEPTRPPAELDPAPHYRKGLELLKQKRFKEALLAQEKALELNPSHYDAKYQVALIYQVTGRPKESIEAYEKLLAVKPDYAQARINLGSLRRMDKDRSPMLFPLSASKPEPMAG